MFVTRHPTVFLNANERRLLRAGVMSALLHALAIVWGHWPQAPAPKPPPPLQVNLTPPEAPVLIAPDLAENTAPEPPPPPTKPAPRKERIATGGLVGAASRQVAQALLYPPEAIAAGLQGEVLVMLFFDESGDALAVRLEHSSGHAVLDEAAVRAAYRVRGLTEGAAKEVLLPVRFRLN